jgi:4-methylaminobutanoate oxidase (formaldehyde-forming)
VLEQNDEIARETTPNAAGLVGQIRSSPVMCAAIQYALKLLTDFADETGHDPGLKRTGSLLVALTDERMDAYRRQVEAANANNVPAEFVSHAEMQRLAPALDVSRLKGGYFVPGDGYLDPQHCAQCFGSAAVDLGVTINTGTSVTGITVSDGKVCGVETSNGPIAADTVIVTAGPWTGLLAGWAGLRIPMQPIRHQRVITKPTAGIPEHHPVVRVTDVSCYIRPEQGGYLYGFFEPNPTPILLSEKPASFRTDDIAAPVETMNEARRRLSEVMPVLGELDVHERSQGMTTFAPDGQYLIGPVPEAEGLFVATGCAALGIAGSAAVGRWLADWALDGHPGEELDEFGLHRFGSQADDPNWVRSESEAFYGGYYAIRD